MSSDLIQRDKSDVATVKGDAEERRSQTMNLQPEAADPCGGPLIEQPCCQGGGLHAGKGPGGDCCWALRREFMKSWDVLVGLLQY